jgi:hypothetical protein
MRGEQQATLSIQRFDALMIRSKRTGFTKRISGNGPKCEGSSRTISPFRSPSRSRSRIAREMRSFFSTAIKRSISQTLRRLNRR